MATFPPCKALGAQCHQLTVTLRVAELDDGPGSADDEATWLFGHTERIHFGRLRRDGDFLYAKAVISVPCKYLDESDPSRSRCTAHGFRGSLPAPVPIVHRRRLGGDRFEYVRGGQLTSGVLGSAPATQRSLPVLATANPCETARCRTADNTVGAACCRDMQLEVICGPRNTRLEALLRSRKPPYLCKVEREEEDSLGVEVISACSFLEDDGRLCSLHGRKRSDGSEAKPGLCFEWPEKDSTFHRDCVLRPKPKSRKHK